MYHVQFSFHSTAFPEFGASPGLKVGKFRHLRQVCNPDDLDRDIAAEDERVLRDGLAEYVPCASRGKMLSAVTCMFTNTPDGDFVVDLHPRHHNVALCSACSGHGFKMANVIGKVLVQLVVLGASTLDVAFLRLQRPGLEHVDLLAR